MAQTYVWPYITKNVQDLKCNRINFPTVLGPWYALCNFSYSFDIYAEKSYYEDWCEKQRDFNYDWQISEFFRHSSKTRSAMVSRILKSLPLLTCAVICARTMWIQSTVSSTLLPRLLARTSKSNRRWSHKKRVNAAGGIVGWMRLEIF